MGRSGCPGSPTTKDQYTNGAQRHELPTRGSRSTRIARGIYRVSSLCTFSRKLVEERRLAVGEPGRRIHPFDPHLLSQSPRDYRPDLYRVLGRAAARIGSQLSVAQVSSNSTKFMNAHTAVAALARLHGNYFPSRYQNARRCR